MDYGQPMPTLVVSDLPESKAPLSKANTSDFVNIDWKNEEQAQSIGNRAMSSLGDVENKAQESIPNISEGVEMTMPPGVEVSNENIPNAQESEKKNAQFDSKSIKTIESLDKAGVSEVDNAINKFNQDGNAAEFYEKAREMMEVNLDNSYNRKLAA